MNAPEAAAALQRSGFQVHEHDGVWWQRARPFVYKPVDLLQVLVPGAARPDPLRSPIGYAHACASAAEANRTWSFMMLPEVELRAFDLAALKRHDRPVVRRGLREVEVRRLDDLGPVLEGIRRINFSQAVRNGHGLTPAYYVEHRDQWEARMRREFSIAGREWWGAWVGDRLAAYYYAFHIGDTMQISAAKSHSDFLKLNPNDALAYTFLCHCRELPGCRQVMFGGWTPDTPTLNGFKERYGFRRVDVPAYVGWNPLLLAAVGLVQRLRGGGRS